jgi:hypothetical protein
MKTVETREDFFARSGLFKASSWGGNSASGQLSARFLAS